MAVAVRRRCSAAVLSRAFLMGPAKSRSSAGQSTGESSKPNQSTVSLGKKRSLDTKRAAHLRNCPQNTTTSTIGNQHASEYGSQAATIRIPMAPQELVKVTILGGAGGIGQPLGLLLMLHSEYVQHLALYDLIPAVRGVAMDLSHIDRQCKVSAHVGPDELGEALRGSKVVLITAGIAQKPGMSRDDLFSTNAKIMYNLAKACARHAPDAWLGIISNPVNSLVPLTYEVYSALLHADKSAPPQSSSGAHEKSASKVAAQSGGPDWARRIFGVTTLDVVRASTLTAKSAFYRPEANGLFRDPAKVRVPVVGGHAGRTILPLLSQAHPQLDKRRLDEKSTVHTLIESIQQAGIEVLNAKSGTGSATLSMAYSACRFAVSLLKAQQGETKIVECAYVKHIDQQSPVQNLDYFSVPLLLGKEGYVKSLGLGKTLTSLERHMIEEAAKELRLSIARGEDFAREQLLADKS